VHSWPVIAFVYFLGYIGTHKMEVFYQMNKEHFMNKMAT